MTTFKDEMTAVIMTGYGKGYSGPDGPLRSLTRSLPHALGEAVYKIVRYHTKGDPQDLIKAATWLEMEYDANHSGSRTGDSTIEGSSWGVIKGPKDRSPDPGEGDTGGDTGSWLPDPRSAIERIMEDNKRILEDRTRSSGRRRKPVDRKHRRGKEPK